ncbi:pyridoxal phosphate-dependent aminotransferase [Chloroflexota bacterium]
MWQGVGYLYIRPRIEIGAIKKPAHGGPNYEELLALGIDMQYVLDFSVCVNPYMPEKSVWEYLQVAAMAEYPDSYSGKLCRELAKKHGVAEGRVFAGSGSTEIIRLLAQAYLSKDDNVLILEPTFDEYEISAQIMGAMVTRYRLAEEDGFMPNLEEICCYIRNKKPRAVFICNPNNPTGVYFPASVISQILEAAEHSMLILDEAYISFVKDPWPVNEIIDSGNVAVVRSMTKNYGLPGMRLGYLLGHQEVINNVRAVCPPWNVNTMAQQIGLCLLAEDETLEKSLEKTKAASNYLKEALTSKGLPVMASGTHYFLVKVGRAQYFREELLKKGILVRDCASFGLPEYLRISPRTMAECIKFIRLFSEVLGN